MTQPFVLFFKRSISLIEEASGNFVLRSDNLTLNLQQISSGLLFAIKTLCAGGDTEENLSELVLQTDGFSGLPNFYYYLEQFIKLGWICHAVSRDGISLIVSIPISTPCQLQFYNFQPEQKYILSRFAYCHQDNLQMVLESPLSKSKIIIEDWRSAALLNELAKPQDCYSLTQIPGVSQTLAQMFLSLLHTVGMLDLVEEESDALRQWEFHDLLFHSRSRAGRHTNTVGKSYRFADKIQPLTVTKAKASNNTIKLYKPDLQKLQQTDYPFTKVLESRKSIRSYSEKLITDKQLGEFLFRTARVREIFSKDKNECSNRPYPSAGACYELELYIVVNTCENIPEGLYHYCPLAHHLSKISDRSDRVEVLLQNAARAALLKSPPQILIIIAARFARVAWTYESIAYSLILKNVGTLYQTMYLVATAMGLAPCAIGSGNSDLFTAAVGCDYYAESSVGEFILGVPAEF